MAAFAREYGRIVVKPLDGMGGRSIFVVDQDDKNLHGHVRNADRLRHALRHRAALPARIVDHRRFARAGDRRPAGALCAGAHAVRQRQPRQPRGRRQGCGARLNARDRELVAGIGPKLAERGMLFVGLDVIGGFVTEINVTSPTGIREIDKAFGTDIGDAADRGHRPAARGAAATEPMPSLAEPLEPTRPPARRRADGREGRLSRDRLTTMLVLAALLHGLVILGISFTVAGRRRQRP